MHFSRSIIVSALMGFVAAQMEPMQPSESLMVDSAPSASAPASMATSSPGTPPGMVNTHIVQVGGPNGSLAFYPNNIKAAPGDLIQFQFHPKNHSVVQSTFDNPCVPIQNIQANKTDAFFSGFMPTNASLSATSQVLTYTIRVKDAKPVWFYCSQGKHCQAGMVGAINAPATGNRTMQAFAALAATAPETLSPGQGEGTGSTGNTPPTPSGGSSSNTEGTQSSSTSRNPAQATANVASGLSSQSVFGLGAAVMAALAIL